MSTAMDTAPSEAPAEVARLGMWIFIASEVLFFAGLLLAYGIARGHAPAGFAAAGARTDIWLGTLNTALLLTSSTAIAMASEAAAGGHERTSRRALWAAAALGMGFLAIKAVEYQREWAQGLLPGPDFVLGDIPGAALFFAWYFFATGLHALHLLIGIGFCAGCALAAANNPRRIDALGLYWHFVDIVWILLYPLIYLVGPPS